MARLRLREVSESEEGFYRLERAMRYGKRLKLAKRVPRDVFMPEDKMLWFYLSVYIRWFMIRR